MSTPPSPAVLLSACLLAGACSAPAIPAQQDESRLYEEPGAPDSILPRQQETDIAYHASVLHNDAIDDATRAGAADRLMRMGVPDAIRHLDEALRSGEAHLMTAVLSAMTAAVDPQPALLEAAVEATRSAPPPVRDQLSIVLARYDLAALRLVTAIAMDRSLPSSERIGSIHALGAFPSREAGDRLIELTDPARDEDESIRRAAFDSLRRLAPLDYGNDYAKWVEWWHQARQKSPREWTRDLIRQHMDRIAELETAHAQLASRYVELLRDLYRTLSVDPGQLQRVIVDLQDQLPEVRAFAMQRIARLHRDSVVIPHEVRQVVISRLDDPRPQLRREAAELLHELAQPDLADQIAQRLDHETDRQVLQVFLQLLAHRPTPAALDALLRWLGDTQLGTPAADSLWSLLRSAALEPEQLEQVRTVVREAYVQSATPSVARLLAFVGSDGDMEEILTLLEHEQPQMRAAVAEALAARPMKDPLIAAADDPSIYPFALRAVSEGQADLPTMRELIQLAPADETLREQWEQAVRTLAGRLDPVQISEVDALLEQVNAATAALRIALLRRTLALPSEALAKDARAIVLARLAPLLMTNGDAPRAYELLNTFNSINEHPRLAELKFEAALRTGNFEAAASLRDDPEAWLSVLADMTDQQPSAAASLHAEIERRYGPSLKEADRRRLDELAEKLPSSSAARADGSPS